MGKIPFPEFGPVKDRPASQDYSNLDFRDGTQALVAGVGQLSKGIGDVGDVLDAQREKAKQTAFAISQAEADADFQNRITTRLVGDSENADAESDSAMDPLAGPILGAKRQRETGYYSTRGRQAFEATKGTLDDLEKDRQGVASARFSDPAEKAKWLARSAGTLADSHRQMEAHASKEMERARADALFGNKATALRAISSSADVESTKALSDNIEASIRALQVSREGGDAEIAKWRGDVTETRINRLLAEPTAVNVTAARAQFNATKDTLGPDAEKKVDAAIDIHEKALAAKTIAADAQASVDTIVRAATPPVGPPDLDAMDEALTKVPLGPVREKMESLMGHEKIKADHRWKAKVESFAKSAQTTFEKTLSLDAIEPVTKVWLQDNAPEEWKKLRNDEESYLAHERAKRTGHREAAAAKRAQDDADKLALKEWQEQTHVERASADADAFIRGRTLSKFGASAIRGDKTRAGESVAKGDTVGDDDFKALVKAKTLDAVGTNKALASEVTSKSVQAYRTMREALGRNPTNAEVAVEANRLTAEIVLSAPSSSRSGAKEKQAAAQVLLEAALKPKGKAAESASDTVTLVGPGGKVLKGPAKGIDAWLATHPQWKRK